MLPQVRTRSPTRGTYVCPTDLVCRHAEGGVHTDTCLHARSHLHMRLDKHIQARVHALTCIHRHAQTRSLTRTHARTLTSACAHLRACKSLHAMHLQCAVHRHAWRLDERQHAREQVHDAYGKKELAPAPHCTRICASAATRGCSWVLTAATSAPGPSLGPIASALGLRSPLPRLHRDCAHASHVCTGTGHMLHLHRDWARPSHICIRTGLAAGAAPPGGAEHLGGGAAALDGNVCHPREVPRNPLDP